MFPVFPEGHQAFHVGPNIIAVEFCMFCTKWELLLESWDEGDFSELQPKLPNPINMFGLFLAMGNDVGLSKKQVLNSKVPPHQLTALANSTGH
jgi:hypothetical protein